MHGRFEDVVTDLHRLKTVKRIFPTLGRYDVVVDVEAVNQKRDPVSHIGLKVRVLAGKEQNKGKKKPPSRSLGGPACPEEQTGVTTNSTS